MKVLNLQQTCFGCPTTFEWMNGKGEHIYFRLRWGYARIVNEDKDKTLIQGDFENADGVCSWNDAVKWAKNKGLNLNQL